MERHCQAKFGAVVLSLWVHSACEALSQRYCLLSYCTVGGEDTAIEKEVIVRTSGRDPCEAHGLRQGCV